MVTSSINSDSKTIKTGFRGQRKPRLDFDFPKHSIKNDVLSAMIEQEITNELREDYLLAMIQSQASEINKLRKKVKMLETEQDAAKK